MRPTLGRQRQRLGIALYLALGALAAGGEMPAAAQSLDMGGSAEAPVPKTGNLDMDVSPSVPLAVSPPLPNAAQPGSGEAGIAPLHLSTDTATTPPAPSGGQSGSTAAEQPEQPPSEPVTLDHPNVVDTAKLTAGDETVALFGIVGLTGDAATGLQTFIAQDGARVTCQAKANAEFVCFLADGTDVALVSLVNGAAQTRVDAPDAYREQEMAAQTARRGIWASLPPPPVEVKHPTFPNTATIVADGKTYVLDGLDGLKGQYAHDLQGYVAANGDSVMCQPQGKPDHYICVLPDGTDIAKAALVNGAAKVSTDSPDSYRLQQGEALANSRGIWKDTVLAATYAARAPTAPSQYALAPGDEGDGVSYIGGTPAAVIDGETVFLSYGGMGGWGYWDHYHRWHGAPDHFRTHMERFHPAGAGLRGSSFRESGIHGAGFGGGAHLGAVGGMPSHFASSGFVHPSPSVMGGGGGFHAAPAAHVSAAPAVHVGSGGGGVAVTTADRARRKRPRRRIALIGRNHRRDVVSTIASAATCPPRRRRSAAAVSNASR